MENEIIVVKQLPIIEEQLRTVRQNIQDRVGAVLAMECTEETYREVKKARAELTKQYKALEAKRKEVKARIEEPYKQFEAVYKACAGDIFTAADRQLADKIKTVEDGLRDQKGRAVYAYFVEYRQSLGLPEDLADFRWTGINVTLSASDKALKAQAKAFLDRLKDDLTLIDRYEYRDEILAEYRQCRNAAQAVDAVYNRHKQIEEERLRREAAAERLRQIDERAEEVMQVIHEQEDQFGAPEAMEAPAEELPVPVAEPIPDEEAAEEATSEPESEPAPEIVSIYSTAFRVRGTLDQMKALKKFLVDGGYTYEQLN